MKNIRWRALAPAALLAFAISTAASAADPDSWNVTLTPRVQALVFTPDFHADGVKVMPTYGGTIAVHAPGGNFGVSGTFLTGHKTGVYHYDASDFEGDYHFHAKRQEYSADLEFRPSTSDVTFLLGYHHFTASNREYLINDPEFDEHNFYKPSMNLAEAGLRLASRLGSESRQSISAQFVFGVGKGHYHEDEYDALIDPPAAPDIDHLTHRRENGTAFAADISLGYTVFVTDQLSLGARARGYIFYVDAHGADPIVAAAPELNVSFRF